MLKETDIVELVNWKSDKKKIQKKSSWENKTKQFSEKKKSKKKVKERTQEKDLPYVKIIPGVEPDPIEEILKR